MNINLIDFREQGEDDICQCKKVASKFGRTITIVIATMAILKKKTEVVIFANIPQGQKCQEHPALFCKKGTQ
jgi:hypothetical protein